MNGAQGTAILNQATKDLAAEMIPLAGNSKEAQAGLLALVQEANPSITTWQQLTKWVGPLGASGAAQNLTGIMTKLEVPLSDLQKDAQKLTTSLQQDLNPAMATAEFNAEGGQSGVQQVRRPTLQKSRPGQQTPRRRAPRSRTCCWRSTRTARRRTISSWPGPSPWACADRGREAVDVSTSCPPQLHTDDQDNISAEQRRLMRLSCGSRTPPTRRRSA